ncbi:MAG: type II secretion system protein [Oligoflexia bacterium]|nr:type II secretion system protein [Oligoflexia bacterium]
MIRFRGNCHYTDTDTDVPLDSRGMTLIEIMVALALVGVVLYSANYALVSDRDKILEVADGIERAIRFSTHESVVRGSMIRVYFSLDKSPQEWVLEFGSDRDFTIPLFMAGGSKESGGEGGEVADDSYRLSLADKEAREKLIKEINQKFQRIADYQEESEKLPDKVKIIAMATSLQKKLLREGEGALYVYPSGERDAGIIILGAEKEILAIKIDPFTDEIKRESRLLNAENEEQMLEEQEKVSKEIYEKWIKE